jgi:hypothetical protein
MGLMKNIFFIKPLKMDMTEGSETSAKLNLTPEKYPRENIQDSEHGENLKSRVPILFITLSIYSFVPFKLRYFPKF